MWSEKNTMSTLAGLSATVSNTSSTDVASTASNNQVLQNVQRNKENIVPSKSDATVARGRGRGNANLLFT